VAVHVVCPDRAALDEFRRRVGGVACRLHPIVVGHAISPWARDRWLAASPAGAGRPIVLFRPRGENGAERWPARAGDERVADDVAAALPGRVVARRSQLFFDGGDFVVDETTAFVAPAVAARNLHHTVADAEELTRALEEMLTRKVVLLAEAPPHHAGMYMMPVGDGRMMIGDPRLALEAMGEAPLPTEAMPCGADFSKETQRLFDAVAERCLREGYEVIRIPIVPGRDGRTYITYLNVILDQRQGERIVYMPVYRGAEPLNAAAAGLWRGAGYAVRTVDCTSSYRHFGSLRCLINVLRR